MAKATRKRKARKRIIRESVQKLGLVIAEACREAGRELPDATPEERRAWVVDLLNERLDVRLLTEHQEDVLLTICVDVVCDVILKRRHGGHRQDMDTAAALVAKLRG